MAKSALDPLLEDGPEHLRNVVQHHPTNTEEVGPGSQWIRTARTVSDR